MYSNMDGLRNCDFNLKSIKRLNNGTIVAGGIYGLNIIEPTNMYYNTTLPKVNFTGLTLSGKPVNIGERTDGEIILNEDLNYINELKLKYDQNILPYHCQQTTTAYLKGQIHVQTGRI